MAKDDCRGMVLDSMTKTLSRVDYGAIKRPDTHEYRTDDSMGTVQRNDYHGLLVRIVICEMADEVENLLWPAARFARHHTPQKFNGRHCLHILRR